MRKVRVISVVKYGRKFNYPDNHEAEQFCLLVPRSGKANKFALSLTDRQLEIIKELGFEVQETVEKARRLRSGRKAKEN